MPHGSSVNVCSKQDSVEEISRHSKAMNEYVLSQKILGYIAC